MTWDPRFTADSLALLVGHTITGSFVDKDDEYCGFTTRDGEGMEYRVWVDSDQEGNQCGSVAIHKISKNGGLATRIYPERG